MQVPRGEVGNFIDAEVGGAGNHGGHAPGGIQGLDAGTGHANIVVGIADFIEYAPAEHAGMIPVAQEHLINLRGDPMIPDIGLGEKLRMDLPGGDFGEKQEAYFVGKVKQIGMMRIMSGPQGIGLKQIFHIFQIGPALCRTKYRSGFGIELMLTEAL